LRKDLKSAVPDLTTAGIAAVDLAQAAIGPGMAVFSRYKRVVESDGSTMGVRVALEIINEALDEVMAEQESEFDPLTRWALSWFEQKTARSKHLREPESL
jgi:putative DNA methylase